MVDQLTEYQAIYKDLGAKEDQRGSQLVTRPVRVSEDSLTHAGQHHPHSISAKAPVDRNTARLFSPFLSRLLLWPSQQDSV